MPAPAETVRPVPTIVRTMVPTVRTIAVPPGGRPCEMSRASALFAAIFRKAQRGADLREALGNDARESCCVETISQRGDRLLGEIVWVGGGET